VARRFACSIGSIKPAVSGRIGLEAERVWLPTRHLAYAFADHVRTLEEIMFIGVHQGRNEAAGSKPAASFLPGNQSRMWKSVTPDVGVKSNLNDGPRTSTPSGTNTVVPGRWQLILSTPGTEPTG